MSDHSTSNSKRKRDDIQEQQQTEEKKSKREKDKDGERRKDSSRKVKLEETYKENTFEYSQDNNENGEFSIDEKTNRKKRSF